MCCCYLCSDPIGPHIIVPSHLSDGGWLICEDCWNNHFIGLDLPAAAQILHDNSAFDIRQKAVPNTQQADTSYRSMSCPNSSIVGS